VGSFPLVGIAVVRAMEFMMATKKPVAVAKKKPKKSKKKKYGYG